MPWQVIIPLGVLGTFLLLGFTAGSLVERAHFKRLARRERAVSDVLVTDLRSIPLDRDAQVFGLVTGEVVVASDYFNTIVAEWRKLIGGELHTFNSLMVRARREALLRAVESAKGMGANMVANVRFATSNIGSMRRKRRSALVEMYAYGTALRLDPPASSGLA